MILRCVTGDVPGPDIGHLQPHEHVLSTIAATEQQQGSALADADEITLENLYDVRRHHSPFDGDVSDVETAVAELEHYRRAGGSAMVDATSRGLGRDPDGLVEVSRRSGVHIVMGAGYYHADYHPPELVNCTREEIAEEIHADVTVGVGGGEERIRAGVIGEIGLSWPVSDVEARVLEAATDAQSSTGAALMIHPGRDARAPMDAISRVRRAGGDLTRVVMSHVDRTLFTDAEMRELADSGCYLEFDLFGQESSYYPYAPIDMPNDASRVDHVARLVDQGYGAQVLLSQDICFKTHLRRYGGEGYDHLLTRVIPLMRRKGFAESLIQILTRTNPLTALGIQT